MVALLARPAAADGQLGAAPWFPAVDPASPQETLEQNTLGVVEVGDGGWRVNRGKYRALLARHDFFVTVGRTDSARHHAASAATSRILFWSGLAGVGVGIGLLYAHAAEGGFEPSATPGLACAAGGLVTVWISSWFTGPTVTPEEAEEMAYRYNVRLKLHIERETGGETRGPQQAAAPRAPRAPRFLPWTDGRSAGGVMALVAF